MRAHRAFLLNVSISHRAGNYLFSTSRRATSKSSSIIPVNNAQIRCYTTSARPAGPAALKSRYVITRRYSLINSQWYLTRAAINLIVPRHSKETHRQRDEVSLLVIMLRRVHSAQRLIRFKLHTSTEIAARRATAARHKSNYRGGIDWF